MSKNKKLDISKHLEKYKTKKELYRDFSYTIRFLLENLLREHGFKYHTVTYRIKSEESLRNKLENLQSIKSIKNIDDLAGCRVIFYLNDSIERIKYYLHDEFKVIKETLKYSDDDYDAFHLIVRLKKDRLKLNEYKRFNGLRCEIQLTTVLFHAWSEMSHDVIYKPETAIPEFDKRAFKTIKNQFHNTMRYIKEAQLKLDFIAKDVEKIKQGKKVFDHDFLESILKVTTNDEIYDKLRNLLQYIREFGDKTPRELNIVKIINDTLTKSKTLKKVSRRYLWGDEPGMDYSHVAGVCLDILDYLKFIHPKEIFKLLTYLSTDKSDKIRKKSLNIAAKMAKHLFVPKKGKIYYYSQTIILNEIEKWNDIELLNNLNLIVNITKKLLFPDFYGTSWYNHETLSLHKGALPTGKTIKQIRERAINILKKLYSLLERVSDRQLVLKAIEKATHPSFYKGTKGFKEIVLENTNSVIVYYSSIIKKADNEILQMIEQDLYWFKKRFPKGLKGLEQLQSNIKKNTEYQIYKVLVNWTHPSLIYSNEEKLEGGMRKKTIDEYLQKITQKNFPKWEKRILSIVRNYKQFDNEEQYGNFGVFLDELGKQRPEIAEKLISRNAEKLRPFLLALLSGIWKSSERENAKKILRNWIRKGKYLPVCALVFSYVREIDESLLKKIYKKAKEKRDTDIFINIIKSITINFANTQIGKNIFIDCIKELEKYKNYSWFYCLSFGGDAILQMLTKDNWLVILKNLLHAPSINHKLESILSIVAEKYPKELIRFFFERVKIQSEKREKDMKNMYNAIPIQFYKLTELLEKETRLIIEEILKWFKKAEIYHWEAGHFLQVIFPGFDSELETQLVKLINTGDQAKVKIVLNILCPYKGEPFLHNTCKELIKQYPKNTQYQSKIMFFLSKTGVVSGDCGFIEAYERKKQEIQEWKKDKNPAIQKFIKEYEKYLSEKIKYEQKRADKDIAMRKREFEDQAE